MGKTWRAWTLVLLMSGAAASGTAGSVRGRILDRETGRGLSGANIVIIDAPGGVTSGADGSFGIDGLAPGPHTLRFSFVGYVPQTRRIGVREGDTVMVDVALVPTAIQTQPIVVSATRARERETPAAFSTLDRAEIRRRYTTQDIPVLLSELPSTTVYSEAGNGMGYTYLNIRGFDSRRIAVMINGIPQNDPEDHNVYWLDFPDLAASLEDVQVQRGAGSAFYGPPAIGGSVNLVTEQFGRERSLRLSAGIGSYNTRRYALSLTTGLFDGRYALHTRLAKLLSSGYRDRSWVDFNSYFVGLVRYDDEMTTQINVYGGPVSDHLAFYGIPKADVKDREKRRANPILREEEIENFSQPHYELFHEWRLSPATTLNNTVFLVTGDGFFDYDGSWAPYSYYRLGPQYGFPVAGDPDTLFFASALIRATVSNRQIGWLPRFTWRHAGGEFITGAEVRVHRSLHWGRLQRADGISVLSTGVPEDYRYYEYSGAKDIASLYAHELLDLSPDVKLMANLQYVYNRYRLCDEKFLGTDFAVPYHFVNPRLGLQYNPTEHWSTYLSLAHTSREPRLKNLYDAAEASTPASWGEVLPQFAADGSGRFDFTAPLVKPESLFDVELGAGYRSDDVTLGINLYWMDFRNEIVKSGQVDRFGQPVTGNAEHTRHVGVELTGRCTVAGWLEVDGNLTLSRNRFLRHTDFSAGSPASLDGNPIAGFPDVLANLRACGRWQDLTVTLSGRWVGRQHTDNRNDPENTVDPFFVVNGTIANLFHGIGDDLGLEAKIHINNIFDALYAAYGEGRQFYVGAGRNVFFNLSLTM